MCGRYVSKVEADLERAWGLRRPPPLFECYNVAPGMDVPVARRSEDGGREAVLMRWGLVPFWAHGIVPKYSTINAACERMQTAPAYRGPWKRGQRCLVPVNGFYEWQALAGRGTKQPWFIHLRGQDLFALGGLWDSSRREDGTSVLSCTIATVPANDLLAEIHNTKKRMPLIVPQDAYATWLGEDNGAAQAAIAPYPESAMEAWPVGTYVNDPKHDDEQCITPQRQDEDLRC